MKVTIIPEDHWIRRDSTQANLPDWSFDDANIHAIQWDGAKGEIEYNGTPKRRNDSFTSAAILAPYLAALDAYLASIAEPEPEPVPVLTTEQKLEAAGLTVAELKELFGLN